MQEEGVNWHTSAEPEMLFSLFKKSIICFSAYVLYFEQNSLEIPNSNKPPRFYQYLYIQFPKNGIAPLILIFGHLAIYGMPNYFCDFCHHSL